MTNLKSISLVSSTCEGTTYPKLPDSKFAILYADCPWDYDGQTQHTGSDGDTSGGAITHYPTLTLDQLKAIPMSTIADKDALLFMWTSSPHLDQAIELMKAWGFQYKTVAFVWYKQRTNPGYYTLSECELCLVGKRGRIPRPRGSRKERQFVSELRGPHSVKPEEVARRIERMFPTQTKVELFARRSRPNWTVWGLEAPQEAA